jgi:hypothetical protein
MGSRKRAFWQKGGGFSHVFALPVNTIEIPPHTLDYTASRQMNNNNNNYIQQFLFLSLYLFARYIRAFERV